MLCVIAKLDNEATEKLRALQLAAGGAPGTLYGHITLAVFTGEGEAEFIAGCRELLGGVKPFSVFFDKIEALPATSIIVAAPRESRELSAIHESIAARYGESLDRWTRGADYHPHTTLLYDPSADLNAIARRVREVFSPFEASVVSIEFSRVLETGYEIVGSIIPKA